MTAKLLRTTFLIGTLILAGCTGSLEDIAPKAEKPVPERLVKVMNAKGMTRTSPIMVRIFKEEGQLEVWKQKDNGRYDLVTAYEICKWSGKLGPKFMEGDRQAPEGFYTIRPGQMNPNSSYHLAFNIGFPNAFDRANGRSGQHLMVHGACSSSGCYSMTDQQVEEIYAFARDAFRGGQTEFQLQAFPFRMTPANMARYRNDPNFPFWQMLKEGYDHFEITKVPPRVDVCDRRYVFNQIPQEGTSFSSTASCPITTQPQGLQMAYQSYKMTYDSAFTAALGNGAAKMTPAPSIAGLKEAAIVSEWSKRRARGERVPVEPPSLAPNGEVIQSTDRMGRIDSPAGRRQAELDAAAEAQRLEAERRAAAQAAQALTEVASAAPPPVVQAAEADIAEAAPVEAAPAEPAGVRRRLMGMFGG